MRDSSGSQTTPLFSYFSFTDRPVVDHSRAEGGVTRHGSVHRVLRQLHAVDLVESRRRHGPASRWGGRR